MSERPLQPSRYLNEKQKRTVARVMEIVIPGTPEDPGAEQVGSVEFVDLFLGDLSEQDRKDMILLVKLLTAIRYVHLSERRQVGIINWLKKGRFPVKSVEVQLRMAFFGLMGMAMTAYYSNFTATDYTGPAPWELIGFDVPDEMIPEGALDRPELEHIRRWKQNKPIEP